MLAHQACMEQGRQAGKQALAAYRGMSVDSGRDWTGPPPSRQTPSPPARHVSIQGRLRIARYMLQGCAVSRYRFGQTRIGTNFWLCILFEEPAFGYRLCKRYFLLILKILFVDLLDTEPVSGSGSPIQIACIEHNLGPQRPFEAICT